MKLPAPPKHRDYWVITGDRGFIKAPRGYAVKGVGLDEYDLFMHRRIVLTGDSVEFGDLSRGWQISEGITGLACCVPAWMKREAAKAWLLDYVAGHKAHVRRVLNKAVREALSNPAKCSPRYRKG